MLYNNQKKGENMRIQNNMYTPNFTARFSNDKETKQILRTAMQDGNWATHTIYSTMIMLDNLDSKDVLSIKNITSDLYQIHNHNTDKYTYIIEDKSEKGKYLTDGSITGDSLAGTIQDAIFGNNRNIIKLFGKLPAEKENYIKLHEKRFKKMEKDTNREEYQELKEIINSEIEKQKSEIKSKEERIKRKEKELEELNNKFEDKERDYVISLLG